MPDSKTPVAAKSPASAAPTQSLVSIARSRGRLAAAAAPAPAPAGIAGVRRTPAVQRGLFAAAGAPAQNLHDDQGADKRKASPAKDPRAVEVRGRVTKVLFGDKIGSKAMLLVQPEKGEAFKLQGVMTSELKPGALVTASAVLEKHPKFGDQYEAELVLEELPSDRFGVVAFLEQRLKIAKAVAHKMFDVHGAAIFDIIDKQPKRLLDFPSMTEARLPAIAEAWLTENAFRRLWEFLSAHGVTGAAAGRIFEMHGTASLKVAKEKPYELASVAGVGFEIADRIAGETGARGDGEFRIASAIDFVLSRSAKQGHTARPRGAVANEVLRAINLEPSERLTIEKVLDSMIADTDLVQRFVGEYALVSQVNMAEAERSLAHQVKRLADGCKLDDKLVEAARAVVEGPVEPGKTRDAEQDKAVMNAFKSSVSVLSGRPGGGKTTVTKTIAKIAKDAGLTVVMCAPSAMAAQRTKDATGFESRTVHSLLKPSREVPGTFVYNENNQLEGDFFIVDESSMMDVELTDAFLRALPTGARVLFVGDTDQLPSVQAGYVLGDFINSGVIPFAKLNTPHRTALDSDIVVNAHAVINAQPDKIDLAGKKDFKFIEAVGDMEIRDAVVAKYMELYRQFGQEGTHVLIPQYPGACGVRSINDQVRALVNPPSDGKAELVYKDMLFRAGDRVMRTKNNYDLGIVNGEIGVVESIDVEKKVVVVNTGARKVRHEGKELAALEHAYAKTFHKSQGSEYPGVVVVVAPSHSNMLNREMLYTAWTRGKKETAVVGCPSTLRASALRSGTRRTTVLSQELRVVFGVMEEPKEALKVSVGASATPRLSSLPPGSTVMAGRRRTPATVSVGLPAAVAPAGAASASAAPTMRASAPAPASRAAAPHAVQQQSTARGASPAPVAPVAAAVLESDNRSRPLSSTAVSVAARQAAPASAAPAAGGVAKLRTGMVRRPAAGQAIAPGVQTGIAPASAVAPAPVAASEPIADATPARTPTATPAPAPAAPATRAATAAASALPPIHAYAPLRQLAPSLSASAEAANALASASERQPATRRSARP